MTDCESPAEAYVPVVMYFNINLVCHIFDGIVLHDTIIVLIIV